MEEIVERIDDVLKLYFKEVHTIRVGSVTNRQ